jgi:hypothetical protein
MLRSIYDEAYFKNYRTGFTNYHKYFILNGGKSDNYKVNNVIIENHKTHKKIKVINQNIKQNKKLKTIKHTLNGGEIYGKEKYKFDFKVDKDDDLTKIFIGNHIDCFIGLIHSNNPTELIIQGFDYNKYCNESKDLEPINGTKIMFNTILNYIKAKFKKIKRIELNDTATIKCKSDIIDETYSINLYDLYFLKYAKGYYLQNFKFKFSYNRHKIIHRQNIINYLQYKLKYKDLVKYLSIYIKNNVKYNAILVELKHFFTINIELKKELTYKEISRNLKTQKYDCGLLYYLTLFIMTYAHLVNLRDITYHLVLS